MSLGTVSRCGASEDSGLLTGQAWLWEACCEDRPKARPVRLHPASRWAVRDPTLNESTDAGHGPALLTATTQGAALRQAQVDSQGTCPMGCARSVPSPSGAQPVVCSGL
jgi:hypothetical protein